MERPSFKRKSDTEDGASRKAAKTGSKAAAGGKKKKSFAAKMMAKMGHVEGQGLGIAGDGIVNPIEVKLRPQGAGLGAVKEKTKQAKEEARRQAELRGEEYEDSSEEERKARHRRKRAKAKAQDRFDSGASTPSGFIRPKTKFRTAADIAAEAEGLEVPNVLKSLIDATGREQKLLTSTAGLMAPLGGPVSADSESVKLANRARKDLEAYVEVWNSLDDRKKFVDLEEERLQQMIDDEIDQIRRLEGVTEAIEAISKLDLHKPTMADEASARWEEVVSQLETVQFEYRDEIIHYNLSEAAVAAIHPLFKQEMLNWEPLENPMHLVGHIKRLRTILGIKRDAVDIPNELAEIERYRRHKHTTTYESMIYNVWLPKVRTAITNSWDPHRPAGLLALIEAWRDLLPGFIYYGLLNNQIVSKLSAAIQEWNPRTALRKKHSATLPHTWLFPWFQYLDSHHVDPNSSHGLLADVKRKFRVALDTWDLSRGVLPGLENWREVLRSELDNVLIRHLLPRLSVMLATDFEIDPADQDLTALERVMVWNPFFKPTVIGQLLLSEFFPKWMSILHMWLTHEPNLNEVGQWYTWWKQQFPDEVNVAVESAWNKGLEMMNLAVELGDKVKTDLPPPQAGPARPINANGPGTPAGKGKNKEPKSAHKEMQETSFKDVVESWCEEENLLFMPLREAHGKTGLPLFRITASASGKGGVIVYLKGDVVFAQNRKDKTIWEPVGLEERLVEKAEGK